MVLSDTSPTEAAPEPPPQSAPERPAPYAGFSMRPAMIVVGLAALIVVAFVAIGFATNGKPVQTTTSKAAHAVAGTSIRAVPGATDLKSIVQTGQPPSNIINSVSVPAASTMVSHQHNPADQYDAQINLTNAASQEALQAFYRSDMKAQGWAIFQTGPADHNPGAFEISGKKAGSDGFYWVMGAVVSATTFGPNAPPTGVTHFTVRLEQQPDPD